MAAPLIAAPIVGTAGIGGAAATAAAGGGFLSSIGGIGTLLSIGQTAASAFGQIQAGRLEQQTLNLQARQSELAARQEALRGKKQALEINKQLSRDLASQNAIFSARGVLTGEGSAEAAMGAATQEAQDAIDLAMFGASQSATAQRLQGQQYRLAGSSARRAGFTRAFDTISSSRTMRSLLE